MEKKFILCDLKEGEKAKVVNIDSKLESFRRLQDIGIINGTEIECLFKSPSGDPVAYLIRGAVIALGQEDTKHINVETYI